MLYDGLDVTSSASPSPVTTDDATGAFTLSAGGTIRNALRKTLFLVSADATPESVVGVRRAVLVPGASWDLAAPKGVWLVVFDTRARFEWALGWMLTGRFALWGLAGYGAGTVVGQAYQAIRRR